MLKCSLRPILPTTTPLSVHPSHRYRPVLAQLSPSSQDRHKDARMPNTSSNDSNSRNNRNNLNNNHSSHRGHSSNKLLDPNNVPSRRNQDRVWILEHNGKLMQRRRD